MMQEEWQQRQEDMQSKISGIDQLVSELTRLEKRLRRRFAERLIHAMNLSSHAGRQRGCGSLSGEFAKAVI